VEPVRRNDERLIVVVALVAIYVEARRARRAAEFAAVASERAARAAGAAGDFDLTDPGDWYNMAKQSLAARVLGKL